MRTACGVRKTLACAGICAVLLLVTAAAVAAAPVRIATFNIRNYLCMNRQVDGRFAPGHPKPEAEKSAVRAVLREVDADVVCLQEIGPPPFLSELQQDLAREGLNYPHAAHLEAADPLRHVAVLSRLPFREVMRHADVRFEYLEREERVKRGALEVRFDSAGGPWRVFVLHLKSPLTEAAEDPGSEKRRTAEARAVRDLILRETENSSARYLIVGDLNASPDSRALAALTRRGEHVVALPLAAFDSRGETWTHRQLSSDRYERLDYLLVSPELQPCVLGGRAVIHDGASALGGSDHRLVWLDLDVDLATPAASPDDEAGAAETKTPAGVEPAGVASQER